MKDRMKLSDEQLSVLLTAHANEMLQTCGSVAGEEQMCVLQVLLADATTNDINIMTYKLARPLYGDDRDCDEFAKKLKTLASTFDWAYKPEMSFDEFIGIAERCGLV